MLDGARLGRRRSSETALAEFAHQSAVHRVNFLLRRVHLALLHSLKLSAAPTKLCDSEQPRRSIVILDALRVEAFAGGHHLDDPFFDPRALHEAIGSVAPER